MSEQFQKLKAELMKIRSAITHRERLIEDTRIHRAYIAEYTTSEYIRELYSAPCPLVAKWEKQNERARKQAHKIETKLSNLSGELCWMVNFNGEDFMFRVPVVEPTVNRTPSEDCLNWIRSVVRRSL